MNPSLMVRCKIMAVQAGLPDISTQALEAHFLSWVENVSNLIRPLIRPSRRDRHGVAGRSGDRPGWS